MQKKSRMKVRRRLHWLERLGFTRLHIWFFCCSNRIRKIITKMSASHIFQEMVVILSLEKKSKGDLEICSKNVLKSCILYKGKCNLSVAEVHWKLLERIEKFYFWQWHICSVLQLKNYGHPNNPKGSSHLTQHVHYFKLKVGVALETSTKNSFAFAHKTSWNTWRSLSAFTMLQIGPERFGPFSHACSVFTSKTNFSSQGSRS